MEKKEKNTKLSKKISKEKEIPKKSFFSHPYQPIKTLIKKLKEIDRIIVGKVILTLTAGKKVRLLYSRIITITIIALIWTATITTIFYPKWLPAEIKIGGRIILVEVERNYEQYNRTYTRLEAVANYLFACFNNKTGKVSSFFFQPPRQQIFYGESVKKAEQYGDFYATEVAPRALIILNHTVLGQDKTFQKRFKAVFDKFIPGLVARLQKGTGTYNYVGPGRIWDFYLTLKAFNATALVPRENWIEMTLHALRDDGSFGIDVGGVASLRAIRNAYYILREFNALDLVNWTKVTEFVLSMQLDNGYFTIPWAYGLSSPANTVYAYCFLNASNQLHLINVTRMHEIFQEIYWYDITVEPYDVYIMETLADLCYYNGFDFNSYFPNVEPVLKAIIASQNLLFGGFPYAWNVEPTNTIDTRFAVDAIETYSVLWLFYICDRFDLFGNDNITIFYPPLSPYSDRLSGSTLLSLILSSFLSSFPSLFALICTFIRTKNFKRP